MTHPPPLSIKLGSETSKPYKSVDLVEWENIPPFAVLTGVNGSGKTQFLQALAYRLVIHVVGQDGLRMHCFRDIDAFVVLGLWIAESHRIGTIEHQIARLR